MIIKQRKTSSVQSKQAGKLMTAFDLPKAEREVMRHGKKHTCDRPHSLMLPLLVVHERAASAFEGGGVVLRQAGSA